jgi:hypothetical protein
MAGAAQKVSSPLRIQSSPRAACRANAAAGKYDKKGPAMRGDAFSSQQFPFEDA